MLCYAETIIMKVGEAGMPNDFQTSSEEKRELEEELNLIASGGHVLRSGGIVFALCVAAAGWYLSAEFGRVFLIGGVLIGLLVGGLLVLTGSLFSGTFLKTIRKYKKDNKNTL